MANLSIANHAGSAITQLFKACSGKTPYDWQLDVTEVAKAVFLGHLWSGYSSNLLLSHSVTSKSSPAGELKDSDRLLSSLTYISLRQVKAKFCMVSVAPLGILLCDPGVLRGFHQWWRIIGRHLLFRPCISNFWIIKATVIPQFKAFKKSVKSKFTVDIKSKTFWTLEVFTLPPIPSGFPGNPPGMMISVCITQILTSEGMNSTWIPGGLPGN